MQAGGSIPLVPRLARGLLRWLLPVHLRQAVIGDFQEIYASLATRRGTTHATLWYWGQTFQSVFALLGGDLVASAADLWRSLGAALRTLGRERRSTIVNVAGLTMAFAVAILVAFHTGREVGFDRYHLQADRIFRVVTDLTLGGTPNSIASTNPALGPAMVETIPEVIRAVRFRPMGPRLVRHGERQHHEDRLLYADASVFELFSFDLVHGEPATVLAEPGSIVLTPRMASRYFGSEDPLGQQVQINDRDRFTVTGIVREPPSNSHFIFDGLCSMETLYQADRQAMEAWFGPFVYYTYVLLREETDPRDVEHGLVTLVEAHMDPEAATRGSAVAYFLQPLGQIHLGSHLRHELAPNADASYLFVFGAVALVMLLIAAFNLAHLARERWEARVVEVGARRERVRQFVAESLLHSLIALVLAFALVHVLFPIVGGWLTMEDFAFAEGIASMSERPSHLSYALVPWLIPAFFGLAIVIGLVAGCYPILSASASASASPPAAGRPRALRRLLLGAQLAVSLVLLIAGVVVILQAVHLEEVRLGFDKAGVVVVPIANPDLREPLPAVKAELRELPGVIAVGAASHVPGQRPSGGSYHPEGYPAGEAVMMDRMEIDDTYLETLGIEVVDGRGFGPGQGDADSILINQTAAREFGWREPVGKSIRRAISEQAKTVVGVLDDFHFSSPHRPIGPIFVEARETGLPTLFVRVRPATLPATLDALKNTWARLDPGHPFNYTMLETAYDRQYTTERNLGKLFGLFAVLAVLITTLGLVGVAPAFAEGRFAGRWGELLAVSLVANLVAWPAAYLILQHWLQTFAYRTSPSVGIFAIAAVAMLAVGFVVVGVVRVRGSG